MQPFPIGTLSRQTGVKVPTIRYYESIGLLAPLARTDSNRRLYDQTALKRLNFIRHARDLGFEIDAIRDLLSMTDQPDGSCCQANSIARAHLAAIEEKIRRLQALREDLQHMIEDCPQGPLCECKVLEILNNHSQCLHEDH